MISTFWLKNIPQSLLPHHASSRKIMSMWSKAAGLPSLEKNSSRLNSWIHPFHFWELLSSQGRTVSSREGISISKHAETTRHGLHNFQQRIPWAGLADRLSKLSQEMWKRRWKKPMASPILKKGFLVEPFYYCSWKKSGVHQLIW